MYKLFTLLIAFLPAAAFADGLPQTAYIHVSGHGEVHVVPDILHVSLTLEQTSMDAKAARAQVEDRAAKVLVVARELGLADKDIAAPSVTVYPQYEWHQSTGSDGKQVMVGYHVTRSIALTLRDVSRYGDLVDGLFDAGVTRLDSVVSDTSKREALQRQAEGEAVADARSKAENLADAADVPLGGLFSLSDVSESRAPRPLMMAAARSASDSSSEFLNGEIEVDADVDVYYLIAK